MRSIGALLCVSVVAVAAPAAHGQFLDPSDPNVQVFVATADGGFSRLGGETLLNRGASGYLRCKGNQEMMVIQFNLSALDGQTVTEAELHVSSYSSVLLYAADVCTINAPWIEGTRYNTTALTGEPCWAYRARPVSTSSPDPNDWWTYPGSDFSSATYGNNGSLVSWAYPADDGFTTYTDGSARTWYRIKVDPEVVSAMVYDQHGLTLSDTRGYRLQNNLNYTRNQWGSPGPVAPKLYVVAGATDTDPPGAVNDFQAEAGDWNGEVLLSWTAPTDGGATGRALGYDVRYSLSAITEGNFAAATPVARWRIPRPIEAGLSQSMLVEDLTPGSTYYLAIRAYDQAGNTTAIATDSAALPAQTVKQFDFGLPFEPIPASSVPSAEGVVRYWAAPDYTKVNPVTGNRMEDGYTGSGSDAYKKGNNVWDASNNEVVLDASRNETVAFQLILEKLVAGLSNVSVTVGNLVSPNGKAIPSTPYIETFRCWYVPSFSIYYADACLPLLQSPFASTFAVPEPTNAISGQTNQSVWVDVYVPTWAAPGTYTGTISVEADELSATLEIGLEVRVRSWALPEFPTFIVDLNGYGTPWGWVGTTAYSRFLLTSLRYFQLGHKHRANVNTVPYGHTLDANQNPNTQSDRTPGLTGSMETVHISPTGWTEFDEQFGRYMDGSAFGPETGYAGPGTLTPISAFYTTVFESWPIPTFPVYGPDEGYYWFGIWPGPATPPIEFLEGAPAPDVAFPANYETGVRNVVADWMEHAQQQGWHQTYQQFYLNNKWSWGAGSFSSLHSSFWDLDEPTHGDDMLALGYFHKLYRQGVADANAPDAKSQFRVDISTRTGMHRGALDDAIDLWVCSTVDGYHGMIPARELSFPGDEWWYYGGGHGPTSNGVNHLRRFLEVWAWGIDGAVPYWDCFQTDWYTADQLSILYSGDDVPGVGDYYGAVASVRMKTMRRAQQDLEYLAHLANNVNDWNRGRVARALYLLYGDYGSESFDDLIEEDAFWLRADLAATIDEDGDLDYDGDCDLNDFSVLIDNLTGPLGGNGPAYLESGGIVVLEAEDYDILTAGSGTSNDTWTLQSSGDAVGGEYLQALPDDGTLIDGASIETDSPRFGFNVYFADAGTYYLWIRGSGPDADNRSIHFGLDGTPISQDWQSAVWLSFTQPFAWGYRTGSGALATITIASPGVHSLDFWMRDDGVQIDRVLLTLDTEYKPNDGGPVASPRATPGEYQPGDMDGDGDVDVADYAILAEYFGG